MYICNVLIHFGYFSEIILYKKPRLYEIVIENYVNKNSKCCNYYFVKVFYSFLISNKFVF